MSREKYPVRLESGSGGANGRLIPFEVSVLFLFIFALGNKCTTLIKEALHSHPITTIIFASTNKTRENESLVTPDEELFAATSVPNAHQVGYSVSK